MKLKFNKPKGLRLHKQFLWITNFDGLWYSGKQNKWIRYEERSGERLSDCFGCRSLKAFKRHLRKHPEIRGKAILVNKYIGYNVYG